MNVFLYVFFFYILLTVRLNIMMVFYFYQLAAQILDFKTFTIFLYMFRALLCSSSGDQIVLVQHLVSSLSLGDCSVQRLREDCRPKFDLLKTSIIVLETCIGI